MLKREILVGNRLISDFVVDSASVSSLAVVSASVVASVVDYNGWKPVVNAGFVSSLSGGSDVSAFSGQLCCVVCGVVLEGLDWRSDDVVGLKPTCFKCLGVVDVAKTCFSCGRVLSVSEFVMNYEGGYLAVDYRCFDCVLSVPRFRNVLCYSRVDYGFSWASPLCMRCSLLPSVYFSGGGFFCRGCFNFLRDVAVMDDCVFVYDGVNIF